MFLLPLLFLFVDPLTGNQGLLLLVLDEEPLDDELLDEELLDEELLDDELEEEEPVLLPPELDEADEEELPDELAKPPLLEEEEDEEEEEEEEELDLAFICMELVDEEDDEEDEEDEEEDEEEKPELAVGQDGNELKKLLLLPVFHHEPELMPRRLMTSARKPPSEEKVGRAVALDAESAKMATVICFETFILSLLSGR